MMDTDRNGDAPATLRFRVTGTSPGVSGLRQHFSAPAASATPYALPAESR